MGGKERISPGIARRTFVFGSLLWFLNQLEASNPMTKAIQFLTSAVSSEIPKTEEIFPETDLSIELPENPTIVPTSILNQIPDNLTNELFSEEEEQKTGQKEIRLTRKELLLTQENSLIKPLIVEAEKRRCF